MAMRSLRVVSSPVPALSHDMNRGITRKSGLVMMCATNPASVGVQIKSYDHKKKIKVFEDKSNGVVCYKDENGELICEGYDEGPRFSHQVSRFTCNNSRSGDDEIVELLQRCWVHASDEKELKTVESQSY